MPTNITRISRSVPIDQPNLIFSYGFLTTNSPDTDMINLLPTASLTTQIPINANGEYFVVASANRTIQQILIDGIDQMAGFVEITGTEYNSVFVSINALIENGLFNSFLEVRVV